LGCLKSHITPPGSLFFWTKAVLLDSLEETGR
jgi:hypothetical protein